MQKLTLDLFTAFESIGKSEKLSKFPELNLDYSLNDLDILLLYLPLDFDKREVLPIVEAIYFIVNEEIKTSGKISASANEAIFLLEMMTLFSPQQMVALLSNERLFEASIETYIESKKDLKYTMCKTPFYESEQIIDSFEDFSEAKLNELLVAIAHTPAEYDHILQSIIEFPSLEERKLHKCQLLKEKIFQNFEKYKKLVGVTHKYPFESLDLQNLLDRCTHHISCPIRKQKMQATLLLKSHFKLMLAINPGI